MGYTALYRKFRPITFSEIVGQEHITRTLRNQIVAGRVGHAYLFNGGRGTGKTSSAKILARAINCLNPKDGEPCNECEICKAAINGSLTDIVEMDAASNNGVEDVRSIREEVNFLPTKAKYRVYIIDEVHMLSIAAFNALLKTLEEPPEHVKFILATTEPQKLPATILSRCQRFDFKRISNDDIIKRLKIVCEESNIEITEGALQIIAVLSEGAMRDALSILERCIQDGENKIDEDKIKELEEYLSSVNGRLYLNFENQVYKKSGNGISAYFDNCKSLTKVPAYQYQYYFSTRLKNKDRSTAFLLKGNMLSKVTEKLLANVKKQEISNLSFTDLGRILYSDYGNPYMSRTQMKEIIEDSLKRFSTEHSLLLSDPKAYALPYADSVVDIPLGSSSFDVIDEAIPFLPMVLSGSLPYAGSALNLSENPQKLFLKSLESGSVLHYAFIAKDSEKLIDTELNWLYSADINTWLEDMALYQDAVKKLKYLTTGSRIQRHVHIVDRTYMTEYDNGIQVYVNYGEKDVVVSGVTVKSMGYVFVEGDSQ